jgi:hypothetical protein
MYAREYDRAVRVIDGGRRQSESLLKRSSALDDDTGGSDET